MASIQNFKCILVTGATSGIGRELARNIARLPHKPRVVAVGRRKERLAELKTEGLETIQFDTDTGESGISSFVNQALARYPDIDCILLGAGMQRNLNLRKPASIDIHGFNTNYTAIVLTIIRFLPHFLKLGETGIITITSGLSIVPAVWAPNYSATKAALHSFTGSLRVQMKDTNVKVVEIVPPLVESELHNAEGTTSRLAGSWVPLDKFTDTCMDGLKGGLETICYDNQASKGQYEKFEKGKETIMAESYKWFQEATKN
ncbi:NAD(P)-binding protein [Coprinopsis marcescibilis]|uniref:NAD(P)-binding protein n=1 Tax=Coprinopsis marcescibilis TaxID=230819 RepID=A0A5C3KK72_COPMA|nr:NAD(P)-binding protein [Coprinopsis marcescibilis]